MNLNNSIVKLEISESESKNSLSVIENNDIEKNICKQKFSEKLQPKINISESILYEEDISDA